MLGAQHPLAHRQQRRVLVAGRGRLPRLPDPVGEVGAGAQRVRVLTVLSGQFGGDAADYRQLIEDAPQLVRDRKHGMQLRYGEVLRVPIAAALGCCQSVPGLAIVV